MLPLAALTKLDGGWLGDSAEITVLPPWWSLDQNSWKPEVSISPDPHLVVLNGFDSIQSKQSEATEMTRLFPHVVLVDGPSSPPATILKALGSAEVVHFSGHASSGSGVQLLLAGSGSGTQLSLTPETFQTAHMQFCRLAVLAACNTTAADPDQIERLPDLRNALLLAGTHVVVASNWDIDDSATHSMMLAFYRQLSPSIPPAHALQAAQQFIRSTAGWRHPYYWAAFESFTR